MGASAEKRKAKKQLTAAYMGVLDGTERAPDIQSIDTNAARKLKETLPNIDYNTLRMAIKADKIARQTNEKLPELNKTIGLYNERFDKLQKQRAGETIVDGYKATGTGQEIMGHTINEKVYDTYAEALAAGQQAKNAKPSGIPSTQNGYSITDFVKPKAGLVETITQGGINGTYRDLSATRDAYDDLKKLSDNVASKSASLGIQSANDQYTAIANRIRASVKRNESNPQSTGLLQSEVLTGNPTSEVIR